MVLVGPLGTPLGLSQWKRASSRVEAGTSVFLSNSDSDRSVPAELGQESQAMSFLRNGTPLASWCGLSPGILDEISFSHLSVGSEISSHLPRPRSPPGKPNAWPGRLTDSKVSLYWSRGRIICLQGEINIYKYILHH